MEKYLRYFDHSIYSRVHITEFLLPFFILIIIYFIKDKNTMRKIYIYSTMRMVLFFLTNIYSLILIYIYYYEYINSKYSFHPFTKGDHQLYYENTEYTLYPFLFYQGIIYFVVLVVYLILFLKQKKLEL